MLSRRESMKPNMDDDWEQGCKINVVKHSTRPEYAELAINSFNSLYCLCLI